MLNQKEAIAMIAVKNIQEAARFYEGTLGLERAGTEGEEVITYRSGSTRINVYHSQFAGTNKATSVVWNVGDEMESIVASLKSKGVAFEHYDMPGLTLQGDIHVGGGMKVAWFKDPDGNILSLVTG
ncbi:VOC family protein [Massilia sp. R2A-15]|uniref:VOC family protein n=1 Tax=Massilia sp. R2A-15 TaxID=3064278 RepID=UPI0027347A41|nr:VOC family protein [Massilia sp. R2A-15]WLI89338.1 VOC family protein [Massilia sp. R2A-15]